MPPEKIIKKLIAFVSEQKTAINEDERRIRFVISTDKIDRHNERVEVSAVADAIKTFGKNPVALACHQHWFESGQPPVIGSWDVESFKALAHQSEMDLIFGKSDLAEQYWQLYKDKHMRACSIGFKPLEWRDESDQKNGAVRVFSKIELYEISACAVGANRDALSKIKGLLSNTSDLNEKNALMQAMCDIMHEDMNRLGTGFNQLKAAIVELQNSIETELENIKLLIVPDSAGFAKTLLLEGDSEPSETAGNKNEQILNVLKKAINNLENKK